VSIEFRFAQTADLPRLVLLGQRAHAQSRYSAAAFDARCAWNYFEQMLPRKQFCVMVAEEQGQLVGLLCGSVKQLPFGPDLFAEIDIAYVQPRADSVTIESRLGEAFRRWARNRSALEIRFCDGLSNKEELNDRCDGQFGLMPVGFLFSTWLDGTSEVGH
jgi:hypothetical protein